MNGRVLICYSDAGNGPLNASKALAEALRIVSANRVEVSVVDVLKETNSIAYLVVNLYNYLLAKNLIWNTLGLQVFYRSSLVKSGALLTFTLNSMIQLLERERPDAVVFTNPWIVGYVVKAIRKLHDPKPKTIGVVIDIGEEMPPGWYDRDIDLFIVASEEAKKELIQFGAPNSKVKVLGMPVHPKLLNGQVEKSRIHKFGSCLECEEKPHILVMGGRAGTQNTFPIVRSLLKLKEPYHLTILCGRNKELRRKVENYLLHVSVHNAKHAVVRGFEPDVSPYMQAADIIVTKAGALTVSEAITLGVPLILDVYPAVMSQEVGNVRYIESRGLGLVARKPNDVPRLVERFTKDEDLRGHLISNIEASKGLGGTFEIAKVLLETIAY